MADEDKQPVPTDAETPPAAETPPQETPPAEPHPLEPGGRRFSEVYRDMQESRREAAELRERLARLEGQQAATPKTPEPTFYTPAQLDAMVEAGQIARSVALDQLAWQRAEIAKRELRQEFQHETAARTAHGEIQQYIARVPKLSDHTSEEFRRVRDAAWEIASEMGLTVEDPRVQRRALRQELGALDRLAQARSLSEHARRNADTYAETGGGGGRGTKTEPDPLKHVPKIYREHWERLGYTPEQMRAEAKFVRPALAAKYGRT